MGGADLRPATAEDAFYDRVRSRKIFTAASTLRLAERGTIDLDAPLADYLGDLAVDTNGATVRQALAHAIRSVGFPSRMTAASRSGRIQVAAGHLKEVDPPFRTRLVAPPGDQYLLAGPNYSLLGTPQRGAPRARPSRRRCRTSILDPVRRDADRPARAMDEVTPKPWALPIAEQAGVHQARGLRDRRRDLLHLVRLALARVRAVASDAPSLAAWIWHLFAGDVVDEAVRCSLCCPSVGSAWVRVGRPGRYGRRSRHRPDAVASRNTARSSRIWPEEQTVAVVFVNDLRLHHRAGRRRAAGHRHRGLTEPLARARCQVPSHGRGPPGGRSWLPARVLSDSIRKTPGGPDPWRSMSS